MKVKDEWLKLSWRGKNVYIHLWNLKTEWHESKHIFVHLTDILCGGDRVWRRFDCGVCAVCLVCAECVQSVCAVCVQSRCVDSAVACHSAKRWQFSLSCRGSGVCVLHLSVLKHFHWTVFNTGLTFQTYVYQFSLIDFILCLQGTFSSDGTEVKGFLSPGVELRTYSGWDLKWELVSPSGWTGKLGFASQRCAVWCGLICGAEY